MRFCSVRSVSVSTPVRRSSRTSVRAFSSDHGVWPSRARSLTASASTDPVVGQPLEEDVPLALHRRRTPPTLRADDGVAIDLQQGGRLLVARANGPVVVDQDHRDGRGVEELAEVLFAAGDPLLLLARQGQDAVELLGDRVEEERGRVVLVAKQAPREAMREVALAEPQESLDENRRDRVVLRHGALDGERAPSRRASSIVANMRVGHARRMDPDEERPDGAAEGGAADEREARLKRGVGLDAVHLTRRGALRQYAIHEDEHARLASCGGRRYSSWMRMLSRAVCFVVVAAVEGHDREDALLHLEEVGVRGLRRSSPIPRSRSSARAPTGTAPAAERRCRFNEFRHRDHAQDGNGATAAARP